MDYTSSADHVVHASGKPMHRDDTAAPTVLSANDINALNWSLMKLLGDAGVAGAPFDANTPASYGKVSQAVQNLVAAPFLGANKQADLSGWQRLPSGLIVQWMYGIAMTNNSIWVDLPMAFPSNHYFTLPGFAHKDGGSVMPANPVATLMGRSLSQVGLAGGGTAGSYNFRMAVLCIGD